MKNNLYYNAVLIYNENKEIVKIMIFVIILYSIYNLLTYKNNNKTNIEKMSQIDKAHQLVSQNAHGFSTQIKQLKGACKAVKMNCDNMNFDIVKGF